MVLRLVCNPTVHHFLTSVSKSKLNEREVTHTPTVANDVKARGRTAEKKARGRSAKKNNTSIMEPIPWDILTKALLGSLGGLAIVASFVGFIVLVCSIGPASTRAVKSISMKTIINAIFCCPRKRRAIMRPSADSDDAKSITANLWARLDARIRTIQFQTALANSQIAVALSEDWTTPSLGVVDNSACYIVGFSNPIQLWARMTNPFARDDRATEPKFQKILEVLLSTGAQKFINAIDPNDGGRPIDVANFPQRSILRDNAKNYGVDLTPTRTHSPLFRAASGIGFFVRSMKPIVAAMDPSDLDWTDPRSGSTALHAICTAASGITSIHSITLHAKQRIEALYSLDYLLSFVGFINPSHPCFDILPIADQWIMPRLNEARIIAKEYSSVHLPKQISAGILALNSAEMQKWQPLIALVVRIRISSFIFCFPFETIGKKGSIVGIRRGSFSTKKIRI